MSWKCCKSIKNFFRFKCVMKCCETSIDCENDTKAENEEDNKEND